MNPQALLVATGAGLALQLAMVLSGHYVAFIKQNVFALGGMLISLAAGLLYAKLADGSWPGSLSGGLVAGGLCALLGIAVSWALKDVPPQILIFGTLGSAVAGVIGAAIGKLL
ncbi:hypothetical protein [Phenylobacterium sp. J367]|uniref:hypothetical protein n=1 Tax=Phenylobacterium sp. J367 TaxID=2898435 RepID=UPI0021518776|nr:hypothetical protein [Phenylobacterium sp. J367]MCR5879001.1 hypothetical protein [Phenylobacterium sp. J367]